MTPFLEENNGPSKTTPREMQSNLLILFVGGSGPTATALTGTMLHLVQNPSKLKELVEEIRSTFQRSSDINFASIADLPYLNAVINEGLRLSNPVPAGLPRIVPPGGDYYAGHFIPEGTCISIRPYAISRSEDYFANPDTFVPERWLSKGDRPAEYGNDRLTASNPFSVGHRNCIGKSLAWAEMRLVLAKMMFEFDFEETPIRLDWTKLKTIVIIQTGRIEVVMRRRTSLNTNATR